MHSDKDTLKLAIVSRDAAPWGKFDFLYPAANGLSEFSSGIPLPAALHGGEATAHLPAITAWAWAGRILGASLWPSVASAVDGRVRASVTRISPSKAFFFPP